MITRSAIIVVYTILFFGVFSLCASCSGQNTAQTSGSIFKNHIGDTVSAIEKGAWCILQDRNNNYWFGSDGEGIYRYDGKNLIRFTTKDGLCNDRIRGIQEDSSGNIYFNTVNGVSKFDGTFTTLTSTRSNLPDGGWRSQPGDLWFPGAQDSGVVYRYDGVTLYRLELPKTKAGEDFIAEHPRSKYPNIHFSPYDVYGIYRDRRGNRWFGTNTGLCRYDGKNFAWISEEELGIGDIAYHVRSVYEDKSGYFWFTNTMHRFEVLPNNNETDTISYRKDKGIVDSKDHDAAYFMSSVEDNSGDLWMVTYNKGVWRYDGKTLARYLIKDGDKDVTLFSVYKDKQGSLWLGTHTAGAYKFNRKVFEKFKF